MDRLIANRFSQFPDEGLQILNGELFCSRCNMFLKTKKSTVENHFNSMKHQSNSPNPLADTRITSSTSLNSPCTEKEILNFEEAIDSEINSEVLTTTDEDKGDEEFLATVTVEPITAFCLVCGDSDNLVDTEAEGLFNFLFSDGPPKCFQELKRLIWREFRVKKYFATSTDDVVNRDRIESFQFCRYCFRKLIKYYELYLKLKALQSEMDSLKSELLCGFESNYVNSKSDCGGQDFTSLRVKQNEGAVKSSAAKGQSETGRGIPSEGFYMVKVEPSELDVYNEEIDNDPHECHERTTDVEPEMGMGKVNDANKRIKIVDCTMLHDISVSSSKNKISAHHKRVANTSKQQKHRCKCLYCGQQFSSFKNLWQHQVAEHNVRKRKAVAVKNNVRGRLPISQACSQCGQFFPRAVDLRFHWRREHKDIKLHRCEECGRAFSELSQLKNHLNIKHKGIRKFECTVCNKKFAYKNRLIMHSAEHTGTKIYTCRCSFCDKTFRKSYLRSQHCVESHPEIYLKNKPFTCSVCWSVFASESELTRHTSSHITCHVCGKIFLLKYEFNSHFLTHTDQKPIQCEICGKHFRRTCQQKIHMETVHTRERKYKCHKTKCSQIFRSKQDLEAHMQRKQHGMKSISSNKNIPNQQQVAPSSSEVQTEECYAVPCHT